MALSGYYKLPTLKIKTAPLKFPVTVQQVKLYLGIDEENNDFNSLLINLLDGAIKRIESETNRKLISQHWYQYHWDWPEEDFLELRLNPVQSITSISYKIYNGSSYTTWASSNYELDESAEPARLWIKDNGCWPTIALSNVKPIVIDFKCGYGNNEEDVDGDLKMAIMQTVEHYFEHRGIIVVGTIVAKLPSAAQDIVNSKRICFY
jgi:uncharacterized phiE125 gp8 family phage protein